MSVAIPDGFPDLTAEKFRMRADPTRPAILRGLTPGGRNLTRAVEEARRNRAGVSKRSKMPAEAGLAARRKEGPQVFHTRDDPLAERPRRPVRATIVEEARGGRVANEAARRLGCEAREVETLGAGGRRPPSETPRTRD